ncbi:Flagellar biosynthetic protein FliQ [Caloramator mitchellensis]|uniref:Flagellar biosynthetic protein FliQ n=1 Tax=Caloramator mitchellensis TaxID=908809 RepID=A0A0R3K251_CALMK|nr:flagellar biosynthesis protein FliQ [Caloramator mitchellensis]KRQ87045.1 Flagellar biosynthetic protein FliQ [Caloramator mitchellensis]
MSLSFALAIGKQAITVALMVAAPVLLVSMVVGLLISIFQAATQIQEQTLTFVPKVIAVVVVFIVLGSWMAKTLIQFTQTMFSNINLIVK